MVNRITHLSGKMIFREEFCGGDVWRIYFENLQKQFTIEINLEYTEFYSSNEHFIFNADDSDYIDKVSDYFSNLIYRKVESIPAKNEQKDAESGNDDLLDSDEGMKKSG